MTRRPASHAVSREGMEDSGGAMKGKAFVIDWDLGIADEHARNIYEDGWDVMLESVDSRRAFDLIRRDMPDVVVIYLSHMAPYGRALANDLRDRDETKDIPIVFVDGKEKEVARVLKEVPGSIATTQEDVLGELLRFRRREVGAG